MSGTPDATPAARRYLRACEFHAVKHKWHCSRGNTGIHGSSGSSRLAVMLYRIAIVVATPAFQLPS
ncbi:hypothetical protein F442_00521 [Phytophthora nicotianae P10297]|uniref:Uncharacterized protein n=2 Tax=Phytophthora nicotianae TaxID=4792 RepID=W3A6J8_PHYNI|nr:hypothetical protein L917_00480 [Phytophthora nicotianae]ETP54855.1 hypothetical protein F442_00521 [Phytophthora nicotianae P10297]